MGRKLAFIVLLGLLGAGVVALGTAGAEVRPQLTVSTPVPIVTSTADQQDAAVFGDIVVWADDRNSAISGWDIYMYDMSTGVESPVCTAAGPQENPAIFGKTVVWEDGRNAATDTDIYAKNLLTGVETAISTAAKIQHEPQIFGDTVIWKDWRNDNGATPWLDSDIYMYDMFTGSLTAVCAASGNQGQPDIYGDIAVWRDDRSTITNSDIYMEDIAAGAEGPLSTPTGQQWFPRIYEDMVVWQDARSGTYRIYAHDLSDGTEWPVSVTTGAQYAPVPFGDAVVWTREAVVPGQTDVYATDLSTGIDTAIASWSRDQWIPDLSGSLAVWQHDYATGDNDIYSARLNGVSVRFVPLQGSTRYDTAAAASRDAYRSVVPYDTSGYRTVIVATGTNWPDALGASALAGALDAPVMIVQPTYVPQPVKAEISRLGATRAIIVGGEGAVSQQVAAELAGMGIGKVERISGVNRYETAENVARRVRAIRGSRYDGVAFVTTGGTFPDALAASPIAAAKGWPIFLVGPTGISSATWKAMGDIGVSKVHILGGTGAVSTTVEGQLKTVYGAGNVTRQQGATRYETAVAVARFGVDKVGLQWDTIAFATGENFPDALSGGTLQGRTHSVLLLTRRDALPSAVQSRLLAERDKIATAKYLGGQGAISAAARAQIEAALH